MVYDKVLELTCCDKNIPAICLNVGPMLNGYLKNDLAGSGMVVWKGREMYAAGEMNREEFMDYVARGYVSTSRGKKHPLTHL
jgi:dihydroxyacid dehydratase/phosphogluconate dehydratase